MDFTDKLIILIFCLEENLFGLWYLASIPVFFFTLELQGHLIKELENSPLAIPVQAQCSVWCVRSSIFSEESVIPTTGEM